MRRSKFNAIKTIVDGIRFDSRKEAKRYQDLKLLERAGEIEHLELQPRFLLQEKFKLDGVTHRKIEYVADFKYWDNTKKAWIVEDVKGVKTQVYKLKKKIFLNKYGQVYKFYEI
ncbi:MAG: DUF1064 domain-containing protein [Peptoniphilus harei]|nr:DUF1064 domain-containing protein [Peptoniphilus harei]